MREDIQDTEIRIIGGHTSNGSKRFPWKWVIAGVAALVMLIIGLLVGASKKSVQQEVSQLVMNVQPHPLRTWINSLDTITRIGTVSKDTTVHGVPLRIYVPLNATPKLEMGYDVLEDTTHNILVCQAADVRADNGKIVGAFVLRGKPLSWGLSKKGYCAILEDQIMVGVADNSPLFEEATDKGGYFFRQYPLVKEGETVHNELQTKYIRRSLCELEGRIVVIEARSQETLNDFASVLVAIDVHNAIYLVGGSAIGWTMDLDGNGTQLGLWNVRAYKNVSFLVWAK